MTGIARAVALTGLEATGVVVEAQVGMGLPGFNILGGAGTAFAQAAERVRAALSAVGRSISERKVVVNLAPAEVAKRGAGFDLAIAVAILRAFGDLPAGDATFVGELALDGTVRSVPGVLPRVRGREDVVVPEPDAAEARLACIGAPLAVGDLRELMAVLRGEEVPPARGQSPRRAAEDLHPVEVPDLADVAGQLEARRALEIAAAGDHHLLLMGPPGTGKSMLARRLPGLLPPLDDDQAMTVACIRSVLGRRQAGAHLDRRPPFAAPHHSASAPALLGGGSSVPRPGALTEATHGVLFLDELLEWRRGTLDGLREPLETGEVRIARAHATLTYPARVLLVAASNPCKCGPRRGGCTCRPDEVRRYRAKLSGPLADRFDLAPEVEPVAAEALATPTDAEPSAPVRERVLTARRVALGRFGVLNAVAPADAVRETATAEAVEVLVRAVMGGRLSARGFHRALRVARTIADLAGTVRISAAAAHEAVAHRTRLDAALADAA